MRICFGGKRGMYDFAYIIIALVFIVVATFYYNNFAANVDKEGEIQKCRASVLMNSEFRTGGWFESVTGLEAPSPEVSAIDCPKKQLDLSYKAATAVGKDAEWGAKYQLARAMSTCKEKWGDYSLHPFGSSWFEEEKRYCAICYEVKFDDKMAEEVPRLNNFKVFLAENYYAKTGTLYANYLTNTNYSWQIPPNAVGTDYIDTSKEYVIIYTINRPGLLLSAIGGGSGGVVGGLIGCKVGSIVPGIGTAIGCGVGFLAGGLGGYFAGTSVSSTDSNSQGTSDRNVEQAIWLLQYHELRNAGCSVLYQ